MQPLRKRSKTEVNALATTGTNEYRTNGLSQPGTVRPHRVSSRAVPFRPHHACEGPCTDLNPDRQPIIIG
jgi:hypothetical protein